MDVVVVRYEWEQEKERQISINNGTVYCTYDMIDVLYLMVCQDG